MKTELFLLPSIQKFDKMSELFLLDFNKYQIENFLKFENLKRTFAGILKNRFYR